MAGVRLARGLAEALGGIAREMRDSCGDVAAQVAVYAAFLRRVDPAVLVADPLERFADSDALSRVERLLDETDLDATVDPYSALGKDPAIYFYEEFLRAYDPENSRKRGVHYSPPAVVSYIVRGVESILRERFGLSLADATVVDPCCGIGTFLRHIERRFPNHGRLVGLELMPASCELARMVLRRAEVVEGDWLSSFGNGNWELGNEGGPPAIIGNPPYSGHSANGGKIAELMAAYRAGLDERNPKWLQDDYVKFIRMAQERVEQAGRGIVAFVTNHSFIFNPTFRAMRESLMRTFDEIRVLDLHGNTKRVEANALGEPDGNVFPIRMGVAITFMVRSGRAGSRVYHADSRGSREEKLRRLDEMSFESTPWREVESRAPFVLFIPGDSRLREEYAGFPSVLNLFGERSVGFVTSRDGFAVDFEREALIERLEVLADAGVPPERVREMYLVGDLDIEAARREMRADPAWRERVVEVLYRPFDRRWAFLSRAAMERPRLPFMEKLLDGRVALAVGRAGHATGSAEWDVVFCTDCPTDLNLFRRGGAMVLLGVGGRGSGVGEGMLIRYIYAILHSSEYRRRYAEMLMVDFPRIPLAADEVVFAKLAEVGEELMRVHLMRGASPSLQPSPPGEGAASIRIGGYELPGKYVVDRKGRKLSADEAEHLARIYEAVARTCEIRAVIDDLVAERPPWA